MGNTTWAEIGEQLGVDLSGIAETRAQITPGAELFEALPTEKQIQVLGPAKWAAWRDGKLELEDLVGRARSKAWGTHRFERSLIEMIGDEAKDYTRLALMGLAKETLSPDELIKVTGLGLRDLSGEEIEKIVQHVARAGFDSAGQEKVGGRLADLSWNGKTLKGSDFLPPGEAHYLRHVVAKREWPTDTTIEDYIESNRSIIRDKQTEIFVSKFSGTWQIGFVGESRKWRGPEGGEFVIIEYRVDTKHWITAFQPENIEEILNQKRRSKLRWLRQIK